MTQETLGHEASTLKRRLGLWDGVAIYIGIILGSGIFFAPSSVAAAAPEWPIALLLWTVGAAVAACGALVYAECGARLPEDGGFYVFYREAFGPGLAFVGGWAALAVTYPASIAAIALFFAPYFQQAFPALGDSTVIVACVAIVLAGSLNIVGVRTGAIGQRILTAAKVLALTALCVTAVIASPPTLQPALETPVADLGGLGWTATLGAFVGILWTYSGWSDVTLVSGELKEPARNLGRTVFIGTAVLAVLYALVQWAILHILGPQAAAHSDAVFADAVARTLGSGASRVVAMLVALSTFGAISGTILASSRLGFAMGDGTMLPRWFGRTHHILGTPTNALVGIMATSIIYVIFASFQKLLGMFTFSVWIFYALTTIGLLRLRRRGVGDPLPWRPPLGRVTPAVVLLAAVGMTTGLLLDPEQRDLALMGLLFLGAGWPLWWIRKRYQ